MTSSRSPLLPLLLTFVVVLLGPVVARAAQDLTVLNDNAPIRLEPSASGQIIDYLPMGAEVRVSSYPLPGGWYRIRAKTGDYGWIQENDLSVRKVPPKPATRDKNAPAVPEDLPPPGPRPERDRLWYARGLFGLDFFKPEELNTVYSFNELNTGYLLGMEIGRFVSDRISLSLRFENLTKDVVSKETRTGVIYNMALRSYPIMLGLDFYVLKVAATKLSLGVFGGMALATSFSSEAATLSAPNTIVLQSNPYTTLIRANATRPLGRIVSVFGELGYRYLKTDPLDTAGAATINGAGILYGKGGLYVPRSIDLSGIEAAVGIGVHF